MKIRISFVTNSSSSSYTCMITGNSECEYDLSLHDIGMYECEKFHTMEEKFVECASRSLSPGRIRHALDLLEGLERLDDLRVLTRVLRVPASARASSGGKKKSGSGRRAASTS